jgi:hypothetical protein
VEKSNARTETQRNSVKKMGTRKSTATKTKAKKKRR